MITLNEKQIAELKAIERRLGVITTDAVVQTAKDPASALHRLAVFKDWDNHTLAEERIRDICRQIVRVYVDVVSFDGEERESRVYVSVQDPDKGRAYQRTEKVYAEQPVNLLNDRLDRILYVIKAVPMPELDPLVDLVASLRPRKKKRKGKDREVRAST